MIKKYVFPAWPGLLAACICLSAVVFFSFTPPKWDRNTKVSAILTELGQEKPLHHVGNVDPDKAKKGEEIVKTGRTTGPDGKLSSLQSKHFVCTNCHNLEIEDPDLTKSDPVGRLEYVKKNGLGFVQGSTFYGIVNRTSWYNDDYEKKYGSLVSSSRDTLVNAIQLCATVCSQGRALEAWEVDAVLHYFWSIEFKAGDLGMDQEELRSLQISKISRDKKVEDIYSKFYTASPATFLDVLQEDQRKYGKGGDPEKGKVVYEAGCMSCHNPYSGVTNLTLDHDILSYQMLNRNMKGFDDMSIYQIARKGTYPIEGYKPYMPHYTKERMSDQQLEDLAAFIKQSAKKKK